MIATNDKMTNLQLELLKMFKYDLSESQMGELREVLSDYFAKKVDAGMEKVCNEKEWSISTIESIANQHTRTSYKK
ncbi:MAG: hypothetical protein WCP08_14325 [Prolixibacteraceae bacterium]